MPGMDKATPPVHTLEPPLQPLNLSQSESQKSKRRSVFDLVDRAIDASSPNTSPASKDGSEEGFEDSGWEKDETSSPINTDFSSVETHRSAQTKPNIELIAPKPEPPQKQYLPPNENVVEQAECVVTFVGKGLTNTPPERNRSLFRKSLIALSRRRVRSSPSPSPDSSSPTSETFNPHLVMPPAEDGQLLSPHWTSSSRRGRSPVGVRSLPTEGTDSIMSTSHIHRRARG